MNLSKKNFAFSRGALVSLLIAFLIAVVFLEAKGKLQEMCWRVRLFPIERAVVTFNSLYHRYPRNLYELDSTSPRLLEPDQIQDPWGREILYTTSSEGFELSVSIREDRLLRFFYNGQNLEITGRLKSSGLFSEEGTICKTLNR